jgi:aspartyl aminopeptidase
MTFLQRVADDCSIKPEQIVDFELSAYDFQKPALFGLHREFVASPRLDNLASSLASLDSLVEDSTKDRDHKEISMIMLFDHEEIGSRSQTGADSNMLAEVSERILNASWKTASKDDYYACIKRSYLISADMAHAVHPNYAEKHQTSHMPKIHQGIVIKFNAN